MSYGADFANADPANAPLNPTIFIGAEPSFWAAILLALAAALVLGWYLGARSGTYRSEAAHAIWQAIHDAVQSAMAADDNALRGRAEALRKVIEQRLGKTLKLAGGVSGRIKKLDDAIAGRGPVQPGSGSGQPPRGGGDAGGQHAVGEHGKGGNGGGSGGGGGGAAAAAATSVTVVTIGAPAGQTTPPPPAPPPVVGDLNHREQTDALRLAVAAFNQHWRDEAARVGELRAAHAELSNPGSGHGSSGSGKVSHGGH